MSVRTEQRLIYSVPRSGAQPVTDGTQSVTKQAVKHICLYWGWFVAEEELNDVIASALPDGFVLEGEPDVAPIDIIQHFNVRIRGVSTDATSFQSGHEAKHSIGVA